MLQSVSYLNIKPFAALSGNEERKTTITAIRFEDVFEKEQSVNADNNAEEPVAENTAAESTDNRQGSGISGCCQGRQYGKNRFQPEDG